MRGGVASFLAVVVLALAGCAGADGSSRAKGSEVAEQTDGAARLEQQRAEVRDLASSLLAGAEQALAGRVRTSGGQYRGCEGAFPDTYRTFAYRAHGRVDTSAASGARGAGAFLDPLRGVLEQAGFTVDPEARTFAGGRSVLRATKGELTASFTHAGGDYVGLDVSGPCLEVPEETRDQWLGREEPALR